MILNNTETNWSSQNIFPFPFHFSILRWNIMKRNTYAHLYITQSHMVVYHTVMCGPQGTDAFYDVLFNVYVRPSLSAQELRDGVQTKLSNVAIKLNGIVSLITNW